MKKVTTIKMKNIFLTIASLAILISLSVSSYAQRTTNYGNVWITDFDSNSAPLSVVSDGKGAVTHNLYKDYHLLNGDPCVSAFGSPGFLMYPQRGDCTSANPRNFRLYLPSDKLNLDPGFMNNCRTTIMYDPNRQNQPYVNAWRMYFPNLFGTTSRKTPVVKTKVLFGFFCTNSNGEDFAYSIQTDQEMTPIADTTNNTRTLTNTGSSALTASLWVPIDGTFYPTGIKNFPFTFDIKAQLTSK